MEPDFERSQFFYDSPWADFVQVISFMLLVHIRLLPVCIQASCGRDFIEVGAADVFRLLSANTKTLL